MWLIWRYVMAAAALLGAMLAAVAYGLAVAAGLDFRSRDLLIAVLVGALVLVIFSRTRLARLLAARAAVWVGRRAWRWMLARRRRRRPL
jgi:peptidoglycan/LPS O-acetylase OafA/YrhL